MLNQKFLRYVWYICTTYNLHNIFLYFCCFTLYPAFNMINRGNLVLPLLWTFQTNISSFTHPQFSKYYMLSRKNMIYSIPPSGNRNHIGRIFTVTRFHICTKTASKLFKTKNYQFQIPSTTIVFYSSQDISRFPFSNKFLCQYT